MPPKDTLFRILFVLVFSLLVYHTSASRHSGLLVLLLDGFRWDYVRDELLEKLPNFKFLKSNGSSVKRVKPVFPADCYPNIYSLFTGKSLAKIFC